MKDSIFEAINAAQQIAANVYDKYGEGHPYTVRALRIKADLIELWRSVSKDEYVS